MKLPENQVVKQTATNEKKTCPKCSKECLATGFEIDHQPATHVVGELINSF